ncbi:class I SAM-dependent methyltransferase [uncultured Kocuria sp.]|uniref:class I SAM-dependent methyltransferase n=1 Tax=uncultured Kocuria sp. TaxID=259305 RepID=UPI002599164D|nr:class I SAM-dependent methyltransferase [uncultured Kocuria sp.]MCT1367267.1 methyltransferase domain-containing protein [Rothia sp. p3-SID1597]
MPELFSSAELAMLETLEYRDSEVLQLSASLRDQGLEPDRVSAVLTQAKLRRDATAKWGPEASTSLFTRTGLEQATRRGVADRHALRFANAGIDTVADLGCGLGADSAALLRAGVAVVSVDIDPHTATAARHNLSAFPLSEVREADVMSLDPSHLKTSDGRPVQGLWLDPARRETSGGTTSRLFDPEAFSPPFSAITAWAERGMPMGVKMGPGMDHAAIPDNAEAEWVSCGGDVVELVLWFNALARPGVRKAATILSSDPLSPTVLASLESDEDFDAADTQPIGPTAQYLYEPDGAAIRAGLVNQLVAATRGHLLDPRIAYVTSDHRVDVPWATGWEIEEVLPMKVKQLKKWVRERGITRLTIKKRGVDIVPESLRSQLLAGIKKSARGESATLVLTRWDSPDGERRAVFSVRRIE